MSCTCLIVWIVFTGWERILSYCRQCQGPLSPLVGILANDKVSTSVAGQLNGWTAQPSEYAVEVLTEEDVVAAVNFARKFNLRLVVKGTGRIINNNPHTSSDSARA